MLSKAHAYYHHTTQTMHLEGECVHDNQTVPR
jgi:hypothetical protein